MSDEFKDNPDEVIRVMIAGDQAKRRRDAEAGEGPESKKGKRTAATEALTVAAAAGHMAESPKRAPAPVTPMNLSEGRNRDYDAERRSADERREHRRMVEGFANIQKIVDEEMDEDGSDMCHILKLVAMAIFSQRGGSELGPSSPEEKLRLVADLVSSELQGMLKQHKAAPMGEQSGQGEELEMLVPWCWCGFASSNRYLLKWCIACSRIFAPSILSSVLHMAGTECRAGPRRVLHWDDVGETQKRCSSGLRESPLDEKASSGGPPGELS